MVWRRAGLLHLYNHFLFLDLNIALMPIFFLILILVFYFIFLFFSLTLFFSIYLSMFSSIYLSICLFIRLLICLSVCLCLLSISKQGSNASRAQKDCIILLYSRQLLISLVFLYSYIMPSLIHSTVTYSPYQRLLVKVRGVQEKLSSYGRAPTDEGKTAFSDLFRYRGRFRGWDDDCWIDSVDDYENLWDTIECDDVA